MAIEKPTKWIRPIEPEDAQQVSELVARTFEQDVAPLYSQQGIEEFLAYASAPALRHRLGQRHFGLAAYVDGALVGMIEMRNGSHISLLFVDPAYQRQGIGRSLLVTAIQRASRENLELREVTVNASPNALDAYRRFGFVPQLPAEERNGIVYYPLVISLSNLVVN